MFGVYHLTININRDRQKKKIHLSQPYYTTEVIKKFRMTTCFPKKIPADPDTRLGKKEPVEAVSFPYREAVGSLLYLALVTRPDMAFAVGQVSHFVESPNSSHVNAVHHIISYLKRTSSHGICFDGYAPPSYPIGCSDADWGGCLDSQRSTTGTIFILYGGPIARSSHRQKCMSTSTVEAEYIAASEATKEAVWIRRILQDFRLGNGEPITIKNENQGAIQLTCHPARRQRTKHIDITYHFVRSKQEDRDIDIQFVNSQHQWADFLTKPLPSPRLTTIREAIGIVPALTLCD
jgi:hypothetical protein